MVLFSVSFSVLFSFLMLSMLTNVWGHGTMINPRQRGALVVSLLSVGNVDNNAPEDPFSHFPSGEKSTAPGAGRKSVMAAANNYWIPYDPLYKNFPWRAGVCGDPLGGKQDHVRGGRYFYPSNNPRRVQTYKRGSVVNFEVDVLNHHNGYYEFYICNIDACSKDISASCFKNGHCKRLQRNPSKCDSGTRSDCGPIDRKNRGRWYLPCGPFPSGEIIYGQKGTMQYQLPSDMYCDHCVIQWYWVTANFCNPPAVVDYFNGPDRPRNWGTCPGQNNAVGGVNKNLAKCGAKNFPEEYWQCADVRITA